MRFGNHLAGVKVDILLAKPKSLNIEIDGPHHAYPIQKLSDRLRDNFLRSRGIDVVRINAAEFRFNHDRVALAALDEVHKAFAIQAITSVLSLHTLLP